MEKKTQWRAQVYVSRRKLGTFDFGDFGIAIAGGKMGVYLAQSEALSDPRSKNLYLSEFIPLTESFVFGGFEPYNLFVPQAKFQEIHDVAVRIQYICPKRMLRLLKEVFPEQMKLLFK